MIIFTKLILNIHKPIITREVFCIFVGRWLARCRVMAKIVVYVRMNRDTIAQPCLNRIAVSIEYAFAITRRKCPTGIDEMNRKRISVGMVL